MRQRGFTLLELMVAMAIFAALAVAGWQVFDSVNRARERAQFHADNLAILQYAYLQLQQDMGQIVAYQAPNEQAYNTNDANDANSQQQAIPPNPFTRVDAAQISFIRFADPDPRYQSTPSLQRIQYIVVDKQLIRRQFTTLQDDASSVSLDSVLLDEISAANWQAYLPELAAIFPSTENQNSTVINNIVQPSIANSTSAIDLLPKGIGVSFTYRDIPISWQFALAPQTLPLSSKNTSTTNSGSEGGSSSNDNEADNNNVNNDANTNASNSNASNIGDNSANQTPLLLP